MKCLGMNKIIQYEMQKCEILYEIRQFCCEAKANIETLKMVKKIELPVSVLLYFQQFPGVLKQNKLVCCFFSYASVIRGNISGLTYTT